MTPRLFAGCAVSPEVLTLALALAAASACSIAFAAPPAAPGASGGPRSPSPRMRIRVAPGENGRPPGFVLAPGGPRFVPWGFNYDHDEKSRLIEDYWETEWPKIERDFAEMKALGANVVRVHLQLGKFLEAAGRPNEGSLKRLGDLLEVARRNELYLDVTGLGCYRKSEVPAWYDALDEQGRWAAQAVFWKAVAGRCAGHPSVFCYDLMNEPVVAGALRKPGEWLGPAFGEFSFVQFITLDPKGRKRPDVALEWIRYLADAVRQADPETLVTVGLVPWSLDRPGLKSGFVPSEIAGPLDFIAMHLYPEAGAKKRDEALETLRGFAVAGKPVIIEETFPLKCGADDHRAFLEASRSIASGWVGFYWGKTEAECRQAKTVPDAMMAGWLAVFRELAPKPEAKAPAASPPHL